MTTSPNRFSFAAFRSHRDYMVILDHTHVVSFVFHEDGVMECLCNIPRERGGEIDEWLDEVAADVAGVCEMPASVIKRKMLRALQFI